MSFVIEISINKQLFTPFSTGYIHELFTLKSVLEAAKERVLELEELLNEHDCNDGEYDADCNHDEDEIISHWIADLVNQAKFKGAEFLINEIESKANQGGSIFNKELKDALNVK